MYCQILIYITYMRRAEFKFRTWQRLSAGSGYFSLGIMTTQLARTTAGASRDTNDRSGQSTGQIIAITPSGSCIFIVAPYNVVSYIQ